MYQNPLICLAFLVLETCTSGASPSMDSQPVLAGVGTPESCLAGDGRCIQIKAEASCLAVEDNRIRACLSWLAALHTARPVSTELRLAMAYTNYRLGELYSTLAEPAQKEAQRAALYMERARYIYQSVYDDDHTNVDAMAGLSVFADSDEEVLTWRRRIVRLKPDAFNCRLLANVLYRIHGYPPSDKQVAEVDRCRAHIE